MTFGWHWIHLDCCSSGFMLNHSLILSAQWSTFAAGSQVVEVNPDHSTLYCFVLLVIPFSPTIAWTSYFLLYFFASGNSSASSAVTTLFSSLIWSTWTHLGLPAVPTLLTKNSLRSTVHHDATSHLSEAHSCGVNAKCLASTNVTIQQLPSACLPSIWACWSASHPIVEPSQRYLFCGINLYPGLELSSHRPYHFYWKADRPRNGHFLIADCVYDIRWVLFT